jgi:hypothetical protein
VRELVLQARDAGLSGPPFNPAIVARLLGIAVEANGAVVDARTVTGPHGLVIQYNPQQSRARTRFTLAHEVAHALMPDVAERPRYRGGDGSPDDWQLELLCNIGAAEIIMPAGSIDPPETVAPIEQLVRDRLRFDVSVEAYLLRVVKAARIPVSLVVASTQGSRDSAYRVDYVTGSETAPVLDLRGRSVPLDSAISEINAIGSTSRGREDWPAGRLVDVECVGLPGYPRSTRPRVAALIRHELSPRPDFLHFVHGDVLSPRPRGPVLIGQLVNDRAYRWGGGVARQAARRFPDAEREFGPWLRSLPADDRLGSVHLHRIDERVELASMVAQHGFGGSAEARIRYHALDACMTRLVSRATERSASVHLPRIGTGGAAGDWRTVEAMIRHHFASTGVQVWVHDLPPRAVQHELAI